MFDDQDRDDLEEFSLGIDPIERYLTTKAAQIAGERAKTENRIALILIVSIVASLPVFFVVIGLFPDSTPDMREAYDRWLMVIGPLAGAAVGIGAMLRSGSGQQ